MNFVSRAVFYEILYLMVSTYRETQVEESELKNSRRLDALSKITTYMREHYREDLQTFRTCSHVRIFGRISVQNVPEVREGQF